MAIIKPFKAIRPTPELAEKVASPPYDVMNSNEAREMAKGNPYSFLHVVRAEIDLEPATDVYDKSVYEKARDNLNQMVKDGILVKDSEERLYIYREVMKDRAQIGLVVCTSIDDYTDGIIKIHERTRPDKEQDRINYVDYCDANTGLIFLTYRSQEEINTMINTWIEAHAPIYDFTTEDGIQHTVWSIDNNEVIDALVKLFDTVDFLYVADGHHRTASAAKVGTMRREQNPGYTGDEEFNYFLSVLFPSEQLYIMDYNRVVKDLHDLSEEEFLRKVEEKFDVDLYQGEGQYKPVERHTFGMYLEGKWYKLTAKAGTYNEDDPVERLDVSILQDNLLNPVLGIKDQRTDKRIDFVGGIRGLQELERRVAEGMKVAFSMYPTSIDEVMAIADAEKIMPPKSTWFEPKLRSGLLVHKLS
jgi:uncharacterized protein (DUF1015 family)